MAPFLLLLILFALAWVVLILPKQRELKRHNALVAALEVGDRVMTGSGFYGTITELSGDTARLELAPGLVVTVARRAVAARVDEGASALPSTAEVEPVEVEPVEVEPVEVGPAELDPADDEHEADR